MGNDKGNTGDGGISAAGDRRYELGVGDDDEGFVLWEDTAAVATTRYKLDLVQG